MDRFESARLYYVRLNESHFEEHAQQEMDPEVMKFIRKPSTTKDEARVQFNKYLDYMKDRPTLGIYSVFLKETDEIVGQGVLIHVELNPKFEEIEVGYKFKQSHWGKGFATELTHAFLEYAFNELKLPEVYGTTDPKNINSQNVLKKVGMTQVHGLAFRVGSTIFKVGAGDWLKLKHT